MKRTSRCNSSIPSTSKPFDLSRLERVFHQHQIKWCPSIDLSYVFAYLSSKVEIHNTIYSLIKVVKKVTPFNTPWERDWTIVKVLQTICDWRDDVSLTKKSPLELYSTLGLFIYSSCLPSVVNQSVSYSSVCSVSGRSSQLNQSVCVPPYVAPSLLHSLSDVLLTLGERTEMHSSLSSHPPSWFPLFLSPFHC